MLILPDRPKLLRPVPSREWREPSLAQWKDQFGNPGVRTRFRLTARLHDGFVKWRLWFDSRDDADEFLHSLAGFMVDGMRIPREDWHLPNEIWGDPELYPELRYDFATVTFLTTTGSNQTYTSPSDWDNASNTIEAEGGGASGGVMGGTGHAVGGGGGAYSSIANFVFASPGSTTATYRAGAGGAAVSGSTSGGDDGAPSYFNDVADPGVGTTNTKCSAAGGLHGTAGAGSQTGGAGGQDTASWGQTRLDGGRGGSFTSGSGTGGTGGGGAAGPAGTGSTAGSDSSSATLVSTNGGAANNSTTAGGAAGGSGNGGPGVAGTEWDVSHGCSSGGGGASVSVGSGLTAGSAPGYGGGGGGVHSNSGTRTSGAGGQGLIVVTYNPLQVASAKFFQLFN